MSPRFGPAPAATPSLVLLVATMLLTISTQTAPLSSPPTDMLSATRAEEGNPPAVRHR